MKNSIVIFFLFLGISSFCQGFIAGIDEENISLLMNKPVIANLASGEELSGRLVSAVSINGYLDKIAIKMENGEKVKLKPEDILRLMIKTSELAKLSMIADATVSIKKMTGTDFEEIVNRDFFVFETAMRSNKRGKLRLMQLLNPGFDSKIKVFADPNAQKTGGIDIGGFQLTGGADKSYLFVENEEKAVKVKKGSYKKNFNELFKSCPEMVKAFEGKKIKWNDVAGHVFLYDQICK